MSRYMRLTNHCKVRTVEFMVSDTWESGVVYTLQPGEIVNVWLASALGPMIYLRHPVEGWIYPGGHEWCAQGNRDAFWVYYYMPRGYA